MGSPQGVLRYHSSTRQVCSQHNLRVHPGWTGPEIRCRYKPTGSEGAKPYIHRRRPVPEAPHSPLTPCCEFPDAVPHRVVMHAAGLQKTAGSFPKSILTEPLLAHTWKVADFHLQFKLKRLRQTSHQVAALLVPEQNPPSGAEMLTTK